MSPLNSKQFGLVDQSIEQGVTKKINLNILFSPIQANFPFRGFLTFSGGTEMKNWTEMS